MSCAEGDRTGGAGRCDSIYGSQTQAVSPGARKKRMAVGYQVIDVGHDAALLPTQLLDEAVPLPLPDVGGVPDLDASPLPPPVKHVNDSRAGDERQSVGPDLLPNEEARAPRVVAYPERSTYPWPTIGKLVFRFGAQTYVASAWKAAHQMLITAAHCAHQGPGGVAATDMWFFPNFPTRRPAVKVRRLFVPDAWVNARDWSRDIAGAQLDEYVAEWDEYLGFYAYPPFGGRGVTCAGFPAQAPFNGSELIESTATVVRHTGVVRMPGARMRPGCSGGPWFWYENGHVLAVGVCSHTRGGVADDLYTPLFDETIFNWMRGWVEIGWKPDFGSPVPSPPDPVLAWESFQLTVTGLTLPRKVGLHLSFSADGKAPWHRVDVTSVRVRSSDPRGEVVVSSGDPDSNHFALLAWQPDAADQDVAVLNLRLLIYVRGLRAGSVVRIGIGEGGATPVPGRISWVTAPRISKPVEIDGLSMGVRLHRLTP